MNASTSDPREDPQWELVRSAAQRAVPTPPGLVTRVLRSVQGVRGRLVSSPVELEIEGDRVTVAERAVVLLTRRLGQEISAELGGIHISAVAVDTTTLDEGELQVLVTIDYGVAGVDVASRLRTELHRKLSTHLGPRTPPVNIHVIDVQTH